MTDFLSTHARKVGNDIKAVPIHYTAITAVFKVNFSLLLTRACNMKVKIVHNIISSFTPNQVVAHTDSHKQLG